MTVNPSAIVDAVAADIVANSGLTPKSTRLYAEPFVVKPEDCPLLSVWCEVTDFDLLTAGAGVVSFERRHEMIVSWHVPNLDGAEYGGIGDPAVVQTLDATGEALVGRIASYASGIPTFGSQLVGTLRSRRVSVQSGVRPRLHRVSPSVVMMHNRASVHVMATAESDRTKLREELAADLQRPIVDKVWKALIKLGHVEVYFDSHQRSSDFERLASSARLALEAVEGTRPSSGPSFLPKEGEADFKGAGKRAEAVSRLLALKAEQSADVIAFRLRHLPRGVALQPDAAERWWRKRQLETRKLVASGDQEGARVVRLPLDRLDDLVRRLSNGYAWSAGQARSFVLTGAIPYVAPASVEHTISTFAAASRIVLTLDPRLTPNEVAGLWRIARRGMVRRARSIDDKHLALAVFAAEREGQRWSDVLAEWNLTHLRHRVKAGERRWSYPPGDVVNFARDARQARNRLLYGEAQPKLSE